MSEENEITCRSLSDLPRGKWMVIDGTYGGLYAYKIEDGGYIISAYPSEDGDNPLNVGCFFSEDEIGHLIAFLSVR